MEEQYTTLYHSQNGKESLKKKKKRFGGEEAGNYGRKGVGMTAGNSLGVVEISSLQLRYGVKAALFPGKLITEFAYAMYRQFIALNNLFQTCHSGA